MVRAWRRLPGGDQLLTTHPDLARPAADLPVQVDRMVRDWQGELLDLIRSESGSRRTNARVAAYGINGVGLILMLVTFAHTAGLSGAEVGIAGGTSVLAQRVLEAMFGDQAVRTMARKARAALLADVDALYAGQRARLEEAVGGVTVAQEQHDGLAGAVEGMKGMSL